MARREQNVIVGTAVAVMFLTGIRSENVCSLSWDQIDLQNKTIHLTKMKNKLARTLPVMDTVIELLKAIRETDSEWVFPASSATGYITDPKGTFAEIDRERSRVFLPHDGRRHFMQASAEALLPDYVAHFLRGDKKAGEGSDMLMKYLKRMGNLRSRCRQVFVLLIAPTPACGMCHRMCQRMCPEREKRPKLERLIVYFQSLNGLIGSGGRDRTYDQLINSQLLYR